MFKTMKKDGIYLWKECFTVYRKIYIKLDRIIAMLVELSKDV